VGKKNERENLEKNKRQEMDVGDERVVDERCFVRSFFCVPVLQSGIIKQVPVKIQSKGRGGLGCWPSGESGYCRFWIEGGCAFARKPKMSVRGARGT